MDHDEETLERLYRGLALAVLLGGLAWAAAIFALVRYFRG